MKLSHFLKLRLPTPHMTRCMCLWLYDEKILPETGTLLRPRLARLVHRTLATVKITDQTSRTKLFTLHFQNHDDIRLIKSQRTNFQRVERNLLPKVCRGRNVPIMIHSHFEEAEGVR
jgi:hypothetical protein